MIRGLLILSLSFITSNLCARDVYVLRFLSTGPQPGPCSQLAWSDRLFLSNISPAPATVTLLETTYPLPAGASSSVTILGGRVSLAEELTSTWSPAPGTVGIAHFDVPDSIDIVSETGATIFNCSVGVCACPPTVSRQGAVLQQVYQKLVPANTPDVHVGIDLPGVSTRTNIAVFNAGSETAIASVELRQTCDDRLLASTSLTIAPHSVAMSGSIGGPPQACSASAPAFADHGTDVRVVSNQPGLTWVTTLDNDVAIPRANLVAN